MKSRPNREKSFNRRSPGPQSFKKGPRGQGPSRGNSSSHPDPVYASKSRKAVGLHACREALRVRPRDIEALVLRRDWRRSEELKELGELATSFKIPIIEKDSQFLDSLTSHHQGICCLIRTAPQFPWDELLSTERAIVLALDHIEDPHNFGAILRTAWLMGVAGILIPQDRSVHLTPSVHKVASGGVEHVPVEIVNDLASDIKRLKEAGYWIFGLAENAQQKVWDVKVPEKVVWVIGSEGKGIRPSVAKILEERVSIPQTTAGASLNASVAAAIALAETNRQMNLISAK